MKGGYQLIDLKGIVLTLGADSSLPTVPGIYDRIESATKRIVISGLVTTDGGSPATITEYPEMEMARSIDSTDFVLTAAIPAGLLTLTIDDDDYVAVSIVDYYTAPAGDGGEAGGT